MYDRIIIASGRVVEIRPISTSYTPDGVLNASGTILFPDDEIAFYLEVGEVVTDEVMAEAIGE